MLLQTGLEDCKPAMSNPNGLLSQNVCHYLDKGRILNGSL